MRITKLLLLVALLNATTMLGVSGDRYSVFYEITLPAAAAKVTIKKAAGSNGMRLEHGSVYCSVACVVTVTRQGNAATGTVVETPVSQHTLTASEVEVYSNSNVTGDSVVERLHVPAGSTIPMQFNVERWRKTQGLRQITFGTDSITGDFQLVIVYTED